MTELWPWFRLLLAHRQRLFIGGLLMFATILAGVGLMALSGWFITATALTGLLMAAGVNAHLDIYTPGGGIRFFALARTASRYFERLYNHDTVLRLLADLRVVFFRRLAAAPPDARGGKRAADWLTRLTRDIDTLDTLYLQLVAPPAMALAGLVILAVVLAVVAPLMLWSLVPLLLLIPVLALLSRLTLVPGEQQGFGEEALRGRMVDAIEGMAELQGAHRWSGEAGQLLADSRGLDRLKLTTETRTAITHGITLMAIQVAVITALWTGLGLWRDGQLSGPVALLFTLAILGLGEAFSGLPTAFGRLGATLGAASRLNSEGHETTRPEPEARPPAPAEIALESVAMSRHGETLFSPITVKLRPGQRLALVGRSGSGKSTLLDHLAGIEGADVEGGLRLAGQQVIPSRHEGWRGCTSYLRQNTHFFSDSLRANLIMAKPDASGQELTDVLDAVGLSDLLANLPQGLDTWIGDQGRLLSGGERRRVGLARALLRPGWLLLLDEPFTGVDEATRTRICKSIEPWLAGRTCVFAGHAPEALPESDICIRLD
ncbi:thiol reductant ABC exporter subunit CydC [Marinobacter zhanjiangensis]|uniref:Cysteine/glutathione ABC transporter ATP-binding protein/permease CydC n=1 Tax=Marinobacter zhanjiangensis TaxID=578215 RepID=A0ABQ3B6Q6_9GAMM|nr:thiol reductant ABC exporter subunit CydC [Marinobacter zhanjiangensis]GGY81686.1 cysteine/glutathione ABC transporter ATP-binding protein/permease CydC [Marinobacter zhanjiangensis]